MQWRKGLLPMALILAAGLFVWLAVTNPFSLYESGSEGCPTAWQVNWRVVDAQGSEQVVSLPYRLEDGANALVNTLPDSLPSDCWLYLKSDYQQVKASVEGQPIAVMGVSALPGRPFSFDLAWTAMRLTPEMAGQQVRLTFSNTGSKPWVELETARLGTPAEIRLALLQEALPSVILAVIVLVFCLVLFGVAMIAARRSRRKMMPGYGSLLAFVMLSCCWLYLDTGIVALDFLGNPVALLCALFFYLAVPIPMWLFADAMRPYVIDNHLPRVARFGITAVIAHMLAEALLLWLGLFSLWIALLLANLMVLTMIALSMAALLWGRRRWQKFNRAVFLGMIFITVAGLVALAGFYAFPGMNGNNVFRYAVLVLVLTIGICVLRTNEDSILDVAGMEKLRIREEEYRIAVRQSDKYVIRYDVAAQALYQGEQSTPVFGNRDCVENVPEALIASGMVAEESVAGLRTLFEEMRAGQPEGSLVACLRNEDGRFAWYRADYTLIFSAAHKPLQAVLSFYDVSEQREKELAYEKWKQTYTEMPADGMNYYEYNLSRDLFISEAGGMLPPLPSEAKGTLDQWVEDLAAHCVVPADEPPFRTFFQRQRLLDAYEHGVRSDRLEFRRVNGQQMPQWTLATVQLISDPYSSDVQSFLLLKDIDAEKRDELLVKARSNSDPLTGLLNRSAFEEELDRLLEASEPDVMHALLMIDVDGFKRVNDQFGHQFGDRVLIDIANSLRAMMRMDDLIGRIGGDEYMVCLKNVKDGTGFLERRSAHICQALNRQFGNDLAISGSVGLALFPRDGQMFDQLYQKADKALYYAKHHGKNRYVFYHEELLKSDVNTPSAQSAYQPPVGEEVVQAAQREAERTLLIVDDVEMDRDLLSEIFRDQYLLLTAQSGEQCLAMLSNSDAQISAVLLDLMMPGMSGLEVLKRIQKDVYMASIPVIVTSAADETEFSLKAIELGATDFVSKPIDPRLVRLRVQNAIHKRETEELRAQNRYLLVQKSEESRHQNELRYLAEHDPLTNICNKPAFYRKTRAMLDKSPDTQFVMIAFDIEKFRVINDIFGHKEGDRLLCAIAGGLQNRFSGKATYGRISSDNFALCMPYDQVALERHMADVEDQMKKYDLPFEVVLVFGILIIDDRTLDVSIMHDRAEMAKRTVKGNYVRRYAYYDDKLRQTLLDELEIVNTMNAALENRQFEIYLQPKCVLTTGEIVGAEALVRWNHPTRGLLAPGVFVPVFEKNGFIMKLDAYVWEEVCRLIRRWMDRDGEAPIPLSANVSRVNIYNPALVSTLCSLTDRYGIPRRAMELEVTESAYAEDPKQLSEMISDLRAQGFHVQMDDFGSAYSSLNMLKEISVDLLKLDMRFLYGSDQTGRGGSILSSMVRMARYLSLPVVAEGVETEAQARFLASVGCRVGQGFYFYKPMPVPEFEKLVAAQPARPLPQSVAAFSEEAMRRVWSIEGDFSLMLDSAPCAASLCEQSGEHLEILRVNQEYLRMTGDSIEWLYRRGMDARNLTDPEEYAMLRNKFELALQSHGTVEGQYHRLCENGRRKRLWLKVRFLSSDDAHALFFLTYCDLDEGSETR